MNKENKLSVNNILYGIVFLIFGIFLLTSTEDIIGIVSKVLGSILVIIGIIKTIIYIYLKGKLGNYGITKLIIGLLIIAFGTILILYSSAFSFTIRLLIGVWIIFSSINRIIFAITIKPMDKNGFIVYIITAILMFILGILIVTGIFDQIIGLLIIIYSISEIVDYIYYKVRNVNYEVEKPKSKKIKAKKSGKVIEAKIEEDK